MSAHERQSWTERAIAACYAEVQSALRAQGEARTRGDREALLTAIRRRQRVEVLLDKLDRRERRGVV